MSAASGYFRQELLKAFFTRNAYAPAYTQVLVALTRRVAPSNASAAQLDEPPTNLAYARQPLGLTNGNFALNGQNQVYNAVQVTWPNPTGSWGALNGWAILTSEATPMVLCVGSLASPMRAIVNQRPQAAVGTLIIDLS